MEKRGVTLDEDSAVEPDVMDSLVKIAEKRHNNAERQVAGRPAVQHRIVSGPVSGHGLNGVAEDDRRSS